MGRGLWVTLPTPNTPWLLVVEFARAAGGGFTRSPGVNHRASTRLVVRLNIELPVQSFGTVTFDERLTFDYQY